MSGEGPCRFLGSAGDAGYSHRPMDGTPRIESVHRRRSLRRAVRVEVEVGSECWDGTVPLIATDVSLHGLWLESDLPLETGSELWISFVPPHWPCSKPFQVRARVERVGLMRRGADRGRSGMGLAFLGLGADQVALLTRALHGLPPPLPRSQPPRRPVPLTSTMTAILSTAPPNRRADSRKTHASGDRGP